MADAAAAANGRYHHHPQDMQYKLGNGSFSEAPHALPCVQHQSPARAVKLRHDDHLHAGLDEKPAQYHAPELLHEFSDCIMRPQHGNGHACILAIARAVPPHKLVQENYADFYFNVTNSQHLTELKLRMQRICNRSGVETRHSIMTEQFLKEHPELYTPGKPSLEERHQLLAEEVPKLAAEAAKAAIREWGRPANHITHLVVATLSGVAMPGADVRLVQLLGLRPSVRRVMLYMLGCYAGVTALRVAKDLAENNPGSRVLICCSELSATTFRAPQESSPYNLVSSALFGDGAVALVVGANPVLHSSKFATSRIHHTTSPQHFPMPLSFSLPNETLRDTHLAFTPNIRNSMSPCVPNSPLIATTLPRQSNNLHALFIEHPIYEIHNAIETIIPHTESIIQGSMKVEGLEFYLDRALPSIVSDHVAPFCKDLIKDIPGKPISLQEIFWAVHPGGPAVLDAVERAANLDSCHLQASRHILSKYGNVSASSVLFVLDELRKSTFMPASPKWGIAIAFGPGITFEGVLLQRVA